MPAGLFTPELFESICAQIAAGTPLAVICRQDGMPGRTTVHDWMHADDKKTEGERLGLSEHFARARREGFDVIAEECLEIADTPKQGTETSDGPDGKTVKTGDMLGHRKLQIETRLKLLAKWDPKRYGERLDVTTGGDKLPSNAIKVEIVLPTEEEGV